MNNLKKEQVANIKMTRFIIAIGGPDSLAPLMECSSDFWADRWGAMSWPDRCWLVQFVGLSSDYIVSGNWSYIDDGAKIKIADKTRQAARRAALRLLSASKAVA